MKTINKFLLLNVLTIGLASCEKTFNTTLDIDIPHTPTIALKAYNTEFGTEALISNTVSVTGTQSSQAIQNAKVYIYESGLLKDTLANMFTPPAFYFTNFISYEPGKNYKMVVEAPNYSMIYAEDRMPSDIQILTKEIIEDVKIGLDEIKITFKDFASTEDYYKIKVWVQDTNMVYDLGNLRSSDIDIEKEESSDPLNPASNDNIPNPFRFTDLNFNGKVKTISFYVPSNLVNNVTSFYRVMLSHESPNWYKYEKTMQLYENSRGNPFAEPVQIHSNVINGVGVFMLRNDTTLVF